MAIAGVGAALAALVLGVAVAGRPLPALAQEASTLEVRQAESRAEYERLSHDIELSRQKLDGLAAEVAGVRKDHAAITAAMIQAAKSERKLSQDIDDIGGRLTVLRVEESGIRRSLAARRGVLAEVLGALQRMGLNPPPALLVTPEDALSSVRSAILLGAVVPEMRAETEVLAGDLKELSRVTGSIAAERERLLAKVGEQKAERQRLALLLDEKEKLRERSEAALDAEKARAEALARKAGSVKELIASLEADIEAARRAAEENAARPVPEGHRLAAIPFAAMQGRTALPVAGHVARHFGESDDTGATVQGDTVITQSGAIVTAPANGNVLYAGPFRSYGQLLILDAGDGYHVVLAGLGRISATPGQPVLAGEPVGLMGEARLASSAASGGKDTGPELYVEFRKDGRPVDPAPWWAVNVSGRTGNDS
jgi:septal ring factor EnvC (AmiA/AmiB activator)